MNENEIKKMQGDVVLSHIAVDLIDPSKDNRLSEKGRIQLIQSVKTEGILNPIYVLATENGRYEVVAGERRRLSAKEFGLETIPCFVCKDTDQASIIKALENLDRKDLEPMDTARQIKILLDKGKDSADIASMLGISMWQFNRRLRLLNLNKAIVKKLDEKEISLSVAETLATIDNKTKQLEILDACLKKYDNAPTAENVSDYLKKMGVSLSDASPEFLSYVSAKEGIHDCSTCPHNSVSSCLFADDSDPHCDNRDCYLKKLASWADSQHLPVFNVSWNPADAIPRLLEKTRPDIVRTVDMSSGRTIQKTKPKSGKYDVMVTSDGHYVWVAVPESKDLREEKQRSEKVRVIRRAYNESAKSINETQQHIGKLVFEKLRTAYFRFVEEDMDEVGMLRLMLYILHNVSNEEASLLCRLAYWDKDIRPIDFRSQYIEKIVSPIYGSWYAGYGVDNIEQAIFAGKLNPENEAEIYAMVQMVVTVHNNPLLVPPKPGELPAPQTVNQLLDFARALHIDTETPTGVDLFAKLKKQQENLTVMQQRLGNTAFEEEYEGLEDEGLEDEDLEDEDLEDEDLEDEDLEDEDLEDEDLEDEDLEDEDLEDEDLEDEDLEDEDLEDEDLEDEDLENNEERGKIVAKK